MPVLQTLSRIFLILALVLNGVGNAYASAVMVTGASQSSLDVRSTDVNEERALTASCSDHHAAMTVELETTEREIPVGAPSPGDQHGTPDCCDPSHCKCPCMHVCAALPVLVAKVSNSLGNDIGVHRLSLGHPSPALPHLIRPPIG